MFIFFNETLKNHYYFLYLSLQFYYSDVMFQLLITNEKAILKHELV